MEKTENKASVSPYTSSQGLGKLIYLPRRYTERVHRPKEMLFGALRTLSWPDPLGPSRRNRNLRWESKVISFSAKITCLFTFPKAHSCSHHTSLTHGMWIGHVHRGIGCQPSMFLRSLRAFETNRIGIGNTCVYGRFHSVHFPVKLEQASRPSQRSSPGGHYQSIREDILCRIWWHPLQEAMVQSAEGPAYHSHSRKINPHFILNFLLPTFKAI